MDEEKLYFKMDEDATPFTEEERQLYSDKIDLDAIQKIIEENGFDFEE